jgi:hypothetical protein
VSAAKSRPRDLRRACRLRQHGCWDHLLVAPLWVAYRANLGTLLRKLVDEADECVEIPMVGRGASLNVAVAGSLVLYRLAGLA